MALGEKVGYIVTVKPAPPAPPCLLAAVALPALLATSACSSEPSDAPIGGAGGAGAAAAGSTAAASSSIASAGASNAAAVTTGTGGELPDTFEVSGVVTDGESPLEGAIVMQGGGKPAFTTGPDGAFTIEVTKAIPGIPTVVAAKIGYRTRGEELFEVPAAPLVLALREVTNADNAAGYHYGDPGIGDAEIDNSTAFCGHCHTTLVKQFQTSAHKRATKDPLVQDLYAGVTRAHDDKASCEAAGGIWRKGLVPGTASDTAFKCYFGGGVLPDLNPGCGAKGAPSCDDPALPAEAAPASFGGCADCHAPGIDGEAGGRDLHDAVGIAYENGNHCDVCHHARDVDLGAPPGVAGALVLNRPVDKVSDEPGAKLLQVMFGPLPDVPNEFMGGSFQPKFRTSEICAACHEQKQPALLQGAKLDPARWPEGLPVHSTYEEWKGSAFGSPSTPCQSCHMPPSEGLKSTVDVTDETNASIAFGFLRPPEDIRSHVFRGPLEGSPRLVDKCLDLFLTAKASGGEVTASVKIANTQVGHAVPTGEPMRSLVLVVRAEGCGAALAASGGMTLNDAGGALAEATIGQGATLAGTMLTWKAGAAVAKKGAVVRVVRPTGAFDDYVGVGLFASPELTPEQKGLPVRAPVGEAAVVSVSGDALVLSAPIGAQAGDVVYLGDPLSALADGDASRALAGAAGWAFARVLVDPGGTRLVPHHRAVDIASDNRIPPGGSATTTHVFALPDGCDEATVTATLLYRPVPVHLAKERGWEANDYVIAASKEAVSRSP